MLYEIALIFISMLAAVGISELMLYFFGRAFAKGMSGRFCILVEDLQKEEAEAAIRQLESLLSLSVLDGTICEIRLGKGVEVSEEAVERLRREYGNIKQLTIDN